MKLNNKAFRNGIRRMTKAKRYDTVRLTVRPEQMEVAASAKTGVRFTDIRVEKNGASAAVRFSDGKELHLSAEELHAQAE